MQLEFIGYKSSDETFFVIATYCSRKMRLQMPAPTIVVPRPFESLRVLQYSTLGESERVLFLSQ